MCLHSLVKTLAMFARILKQLKTSNCDSGFHWSTLEFSQKFTLVFTRLWKHRENVLLILKNFHFSAYQVLRWCLFLLQDIVATLEEKRKAKSAVYFEHKKKLMVSKLDSIFLQVVCFQLLRLKLYNYILSRYKWVMSFKNYFSVVLIFFLVSCH